MNPEEKPPREQQEPEAASLSRLRTYKGDVTESLKSGGQSLAGMILAEKSRQEKQSGETPVAEEKNFWTQNGLFVAGGILLAITALGIVAFLFLRSPDEKPTVRSVASWNPIFVEIEKTILLERVRAGEITAEIEKIKSGTPMPINAILHAVFGKSVSSTDGPREIPITTKELLSAFSDSIPDQLTRTLTDSFFFGLHSFRTVSPVLIIQNQFYDGAFLGMLRWEPFMLHDIAPLFLIKPDTGQMTFTDGIIKNIDARILRNAGGNTLLLYSFVDRKTIVITTSAETFEEVITRLQAPRPVTQ